MGTFATTAAQAQDKILLIINGALGDKSFFDSAAKGMKMIKDKYGDDVETKISKSATIRRNGSRCSSMRPNRTGT